MKFKTFSKIVLWATIYVGSIGFVLPELFSAKSDLAVFGGVLLSLLLIYRAITFIPWGKVQKLVDDMFI